METTITLKPSEFGSDLYQRIKAFIDVKEISQITIKVISKNKEKILYKETQTQANQRIEKSIKDVENGKGITLTAKEFERLTAKLIKEKVA